MTTHLERQIERQIGYFERKRTMAVIGDARNAQALAYKVDDLVTKLKKNRENHREIFLEAFEKYRESAIAELEKNLEEVKRGTGIMRITRLVVPEDHTADYDCMIKMFEMTKNAGAEFVELDHNDFNQYVMDNWGWSDNFNSNASSYTGKRYK